MMKVESRKLRLCMASSAVAIVTAIALLVYTTRPQIASADTAHLKATTQYNGETLFRGLYFGEGPVASHFPEIWHAPQVEQRLSSVEGSEEWVSTKDQAVAWVRNSDPTFFQRFEQDVQSGDHIKVSRAYKEGSQKLSAFAQSMGVDPNSPEASAGVGIVIVLVAAAAVAVWVWKYTWTYSSSTAGEPIQEDVFVNAIVERLGSTSLPNPYNIR